MKRLVIVAGASGSLGRAYLDHYASASDTKRIAIARAALPKEAAEETLTLDLLNATSTREAVQSLDLSDVSEVQYIHPVGKFKFEESGTPEIDADNDGIDDEVFASNITTFENVIEPLTERMREEKLRMSLTVCAFGSISDRHVVKYWQSYSRSKIILRDLLHRLSEQEDLKIKGVFVEVSTTDTEKERELRPFAETEYWLPAKEIVERSFPEFEAKGRWRDVHIFKPVPGFEHEYFKNLPAVQEKWGREMGKKLK